MPRAPRPGRPPAPSPLQRTDARITALRATFRTMGRVAPGLAARLAEAIFSRPPKAERRPREEAFLATGRPRRVATPRHDLAAWDWGEGPRVLLVHGWGSCAGRFSAIGPALLEAGYSVTAFDAPGHGSSTGWRSSMIEFAQAIEAVAAASPPLHALVGHSLGGAAITYALSRGLQAGRAVLLAPPADLAGFSHKFAQLLAIPPGTRATMQRNLERRFSVRWEDIHVARLASGVRIPALVIHDDDDLDVPWTEGQAIVAAWPGAALVRTKGLGHRSILRDPDVVRRVVAFVREGAAAPPGGVAG